ncbi:MAG TPA: hypothetical protein VKR61_09425 [Bryobacteraceae bacterium]|nr:hypothetical protein [Bryobacteraceae bacterium]
MPEDIFRWVIAIGVFLACAGAIWQAVSLAAIYRAGKEAAQAGKDMQGKLGPLFDRFDATLTAAGKILEENRSRISEITAETLTTVKIVRQQADQVSRLMDDASGRAQARIAQIDETVEQTVAQVDQARDSVKGAVLRPAREVSGLVAGVKAAFSTYAQGGSRNSPEHVTQDEEMFI